MSFFRLLTEVEGITIPNTGQIVFDALYKNDCIINFISLFILTVLIGVAIIFGWKIIRKFAKFIWEIIKGILLTKHDEYNNKVD